MKGYRTLIANLVAVVFSAMAMAGMEVPVEAQNHILLGILALVNIVLRFDTDTPVGKKEPKPDPIDEIVKPINKQSGFAHLNSMLFIVVLMTAFLSGCETFKRMADADVWQPFKDCASVTAVSSNKIGACYVSAKILATNADGAADSGLITSEQEKKFLDGIEEAVALLGYARSFVESDAEGSVRQLQAAQTILMRLLDEIPKPE